MGRTTMQLPELNALARDLRESEHVESAIVRGFGGDDITEATSVAIDVVGDCAPSALTDAINGDRVRVANMRANIDGKLDTCVFIRK